MTGGVEEESRHGGGGGALPVQGTGRLLTSTREKSAWGCGREGVGGREVGLQRKYGREGIRCSDMKREGGRGGNVREGSRLTCE